MSVELLKLKEIHKFSMVKLTLGEKLLLGLFFVVGWVSFIVISYKLGEIVDFQLNRLIIPFVYFIASGFCWVSLMLFLRPKKIVKVKEPVVEEKIEVVEKPVVIEKIVEKEVPIPKITTLKDGEKDYLVGSKQTMKFHTYDCKWADNIKKENRIYFKERSEAFKSGFKKCKTCM